MRRRKSPYPSDRIGVFKHLADVPAHHRLKQYTDEYADRDVWQEFCLEGEYDQSPTDEFRAEVDRVGDRWKAFMTHRGRHHALATPADVEAWCQTLLEEGSPRRAHDYWIRIRRFYDWLQWHTEHPHIYHPVVMAAIEYEGAGRIWQEKRTRWENAYESYEATQ